MVNSEWCAGVRLFYSSPLIISPLTMPMRFPFLLLLILAPLAAGLAAELRVLTFNIRYDRPDPGVRAWTERREAVAAIIREHADVAGLQEVLPNQRQELVERCPEFAFVGVGREPDDRGESSPVLYRRDRFALLDSGTFWFSDTPAVVGSKSWGNDIPRICSWAKLRVVQGGAEFWFFNVHLDHRSQPSRERSAALLLERIAARAGQEPAVVTGDFNATPENAAIQAMVRAPSPLASIYTLAGIPAAGTFHDFTGQPGPGAIDFIFLDPAAWKVSVAEILTSQLPKHPEAWPWDHFPVRAVIEKR